MSATSQFKETLNGVVPDIRFNNVTFSYPTRQEASALRDFTMIARAGEVTALVGSSGSGKYCIHAQLRK